MLQRFEADNNDDAEGNPAGGWVQGKGLQIQWQNGPLGRGAERKEPNGAFVETVIEAAKQRLEYYQEGKFACDENAQAIGFLEEALDVLHKRTADREDRDVEGTHSL